MSEPLLLNQVNTKSTSCRHLIRNTLIPVICTLIGVAGLWIGFAVSNKKTGGWYEQYYPCDLKAVSYSGVSVATLILCGWTLLLFILNIIECCMVKRSKYYVTPSTNKSYIITSLVLSIYFVTLIFHSDLIASVIPGIFLYTFAGIEGFYSISWSFGTCDHCLCCTMHRWFKYITYSCSAIIALILIMFAIYLYNIDNDDVLLTAALLLFFIVMISVIIFNIILWIAFAHYTYSLTLLRADYVPHLLNEHTLKSIQTKMWRVAIYGVSTLFITISYIIRFIMLTESAAHYFTNIESETLLSDSFEDDIYVFVNNVSVLSVLTLILYFEQPSLYYIRFVHPYSMCTHCKSPYLKSLYCQVCGASMNEHAKPQSINYNSQSVECFDEQGNKELESMAMHRLSIIDCNGADDIRECEVFKRISTISSKSVFIDPSQNEFMDALKKMYDDYTDLENDFIHIIDEHDTNNAVDNCQCNQYDDRYGRRSKKRRENTDVYEAYLIDLICNIHYYLHHKIQRPRRRITFKPQNNTIMEELDNKYDDDDNGDAGDDGDDHLSDEYGFGSFIYYQLLQSNKYKSFKEEMIEHDGVDMNEWNIKYKESEEKVKTEKAKKCKTINNHNNILKIQQIQIADILAVKFYTDLTELQYEFRKSFRKISQSDSDNDIIERHLNKYYFWGKWLNHAITVYGDTINNNGIDTYYHGLNGKYMFESLRKDFNIPTSVTTDICIALEFAGTDGIVLQLKCQWDYESQWNRSKALPVKWISSVPREKEVLLFGNFNQLMIVNIYLVNNGYIDIDNNKTHKVIIQTIINFERLCNGMELDDQFNDTKHDNMMKMLIENEFNGEWNDNYFSKLFHNICESRYDVVVETFINYNTKSPNILKILDNDDTDCGNMIRMLSQILSNANRVIEIKKYNEKKLEALRIELLQESKLL